jgi:PAS domain S-box-containing protein
MLILWPVSIALADEPQKNVLLFASENINRPAMALINPKLQSTLRDRWGSALQIYDEGLDHLRIPDERYDADLVQLLKRKYDGVHLDLVFAVGPPALRFLVKHQEELFPNTPIVFMSTDQSRIADLPLGSNITGVSAKVEVAPTLDLALGFQPQTQQVVVVAGHSSLDEGLVELARREFRPYEGKLNFTYLTNQTPEEVRRRLAILPDKTIVIFLSFSRDAAGISYTNGEVISLLASSSTAPIYGVSQTFMGWGLLGGRLLSYDAVGRRAGQMGLRILDGERPQNIPQETVPSVTMLDWRQIRHWGIDERKVPAGSVVLFRELSIWELYKWRIVGVISLCIIEALLIVALLINRRRRRQAEKENERLARVAEANRRRLDEVVSNVPGIVWEVKAEPGTDLRRATFVSEYVEKLLGYSVDEWLATPGFALKIIPEEDREQSMREAQALFESGKEGVLQFKWNTKDGRLIWVESQFAPVIDDTGKPIGIRGVTMDITDRKNAEEALKSAHEEVSRLKNQLEAENLYLKEEINLTLNVDEIVGRSNAIKYVLFKIEQVSKTGSTVLILGETGTGKELVARAIHSQSQRKDRPLVKVNCAALSASLIESELFGHERGSFTGASNRKLGRFELADGATLFLDEIGELPLDLQSKLLRVLQEGEFERLGSSKTQKVDVRIIAATNRNMKAAVAKGAFREDLWYRLNVFPISIPPLRERSEDIPELVEHFVKAMSNSFGKPITSISSPTLKKLREYSWPGNVRELANVIERAVINAQGEVLHIVEQFEQTHAEETSATTQTLEELEREHIIRTLDRTAWRVGGPQGAAKVLGLNPSTLRTRMVKLGIQRNLSVGAAGGES